MPRLMSSHTAHSCCPPGLQERHLLATIQRLCTGLVCLESLHFRVIDTAQLASAASFYMYQPPVSQVENFAVGTCLAFLHRNINNMTAKHVLTPTCDSEGWQNDAARDSCAIVTTRVDQAACCGCGVDRSQ